MLKKLVLIVIVLTALLASAGPAFAQTVANFYVDTAYTGTELGTQTQPFNTVEEAIAAAQAQPYGGNIYTKTNGVWVFYAYIAPIVPPDTGTLLSGSFLFILLGLLSLGLIVGGWFLLRRSHGRSQLA